MEVHSTGWACTNCIMILANGEDDPEWSETERDDHYASMDTNIGDLDVTIGGDHEPLCENVEWVCAYSLCHQILTEDNKDSDCVNEYGHDPVYKSWIGTTDCYCETIDFSWSSCDTCGSHLGGSRHAVTFFKCQN